MQEAVINAEAEAEPSQRKLMKEREIEEEAHLSLVLELSLGKPAQWNL